MILNKYIYIGKENYSNNLPTLESSYDLILNKIYRDIPIIRILRNLYPDRFVLYIEEKPIKPIKYNNYLGFLRMAEIQAVLDPFDVSMLRMEDIAP